MIIGIDNISPGMATSHKTLGGMRHFLQGLVTCLPMYGSQHEFVVFTPDWADPFEWPLVPNLRISYCKNVPRQQIGRVVYEQLRLPEQLGQQKISLWLGTCNTLPLRWWGQSVLIVQSLQYFTQPAGYSWPRRLYLQSLVPASLRRAERSITFSQAAKHEIVRRLKITPSKIEVIYHALRFSEAVLNGADSRIARESIARKIGGEYILSVSAFYPYKNLARLIEAFARLKPDLPHKLAFSGAETPAVTKEDLLQVARRFSVEHDIVFLGRVPDEELPAYYRQAAVLAMPSLDETFGFPVLEAMAFGCPVVTSNLSSMPEIAGEQPASRSLQVADIADGLRRVLREKACGRNDRGWPDSSAGFTYERFFKLLHVISS
jgi:glycosyltransferase involved in cell wall biosynthesis